MTDCYQSKTTMPRDNRPPASGSPSATDLATVGNAALSDGSDIGWCTRCGRWQRRRHAYVEEFGPDDREAWCITGGCDATWNAGVVLVRSARPAQEGSNGATSVTWPHQETVRGLVEWAADHGFIGTADELNDCAARSNS